MKWYLVCRLIDGSGATTTTAKQSYLPRKTVILIDATTAQEEKKETKSKCGTRTQTIKLIQLEWGCSSSSSTFSKLTFYQSSRAVIT